jgi:hypothetical protein
MISFYKWKKTAVFVMLGVVPFVLFMLVFFPTIKFYTITIAGESYRVMYLDVMNVMIAISVAVVAVVILLLLGNKWLRHAFTNMLEGKGLITLILDSTGVIGSFNVQVAAPKMKGVLPQKGIPDIEDIYDTDMLHRLMVPQNASMTKAVTFEKDENNKLTFGDEVDVIVLPPQEKRYDFLHMFENRPVFIFNKVMGKFLSRDALANYEKDIEIKHNALNILRKVQETDTNFRNFGRYVAETSKPVKPGLFKSKYMKYIIIAAIVGLVVLLIFMFLPGVLNAASNVGAP